ncbi:MAG: 3-deoxy-manno-octulosonate cytidylyltransferase [Candidatus Omnitrophota bacterium]|nr:3-deoxy-manno-octulosonate cytidylyltransferase [Candidatus Omnitrophota bacterium]
MRKRKVVGVIPARMEASRFPGKPLAMILGLPMIEHVRRRVCLSDVFDDIYVATCNKEIFDTVRKNGGKALMTANTHQRCTDRVEEAVREIDADIVVIIQGDEPLLDPHIFHSLIEPMLRDNFLKCANLLSVINEKSDLADTDIVKAVLDEQGFVMYYSRAPIPYLRADKSRPMYRQTGLSVFTKKFIQLFSNLAPTPLEKAESVDFLRILEHGYEIKGVLYNNMTVGIDRQDDIQKVETILKADPKQFGIYENILKI